MGTTQSKLRKHLENAEEVAAMNLFMSSSDLKKKFDPNSSYGEGHGFITPLQLACKGGMKNIVRYFLNDFEGNPNKKTVQEENCVHLVCRTPNGHVPCVEEARLECVQILLDWKGPTLGDGNEEIVDITLSDKAGNTPLHYAAQSGMKNIVKLLLRRGSDLFVENEDKQTACDMAEQAQHTELATFLESKMVFSEKPEDEMEFEPAACTEYIEEYQGLRAQDLQEAKDKLIVETADMLRVPLFSAQILLQKYEWSREQLLDDWMTSAIQCCQKAGIELPQHLASNSVAVTATDHLDSHRSSCVRLADCDEAVVCDICTLELDDSDNSLPSLPCQHRFCKECWTRYLTEKIGAGVTTNIGCPGYGCEMLVPSEMTEELVSRDTARKYLQFDIQAFVETNPNIKWCPRPGCGRAVLLPDQTSPRHRVTPMSADIQTSRAVDCGNQHCFCWDCSDDAHEPCSCDNWKKWFEKIASVRPEQMSSSDVESDAAANMLWLVTNAKPCPSCKAPIQKNEGCNHIKCYKCKSDFCWVCLEPWKRHSSATGGYFRCNRFEVVRQVEAAAESQRTEAEENNRKTQEMKKFVHYYTRFKNHENSYKLEEPLLQSAKHKMTSLAQAMSDADNGVEETRFIEDAVRTLLVARRTLKCSYAFGYYLEDCGIRKTVYEFLQEELEQTVEQLSQMVARPYLRTPRHQIVSTAGALTRRRQEFLSSVHKGLVPNETPPEIRRRTNRRRSSWDLDDEQRRDTLDSLATTDRSGWTDQSVDRSRMSWTRDSRGKFVNVDALLEFPLLDDAESEPTTDPERQCQRTGCNKARKAHPTSPDQLVSHCSWRCYQADKTDELATPSRSSRDQDCGLELLRSLGLSRERDEESGWLRNTLADNDDSSELGFDLDLQRALALSRLSMDEPRDQPTVDQPDQSEASGVGEVGESEEEQMRLAIALSLLDNPQEADSAEINQSPTSQSTDPSSHQPHVCEAVISYDPSADSAPSEGTSGLSNYLCGPSSSPAEPSNVSDSARLYSEGFGAIKQLNVANLYVAPEDSDDDKNEDKNFLDPADFLGRRSNSDSDDEIDFSMFNWSSA